MNPRLCDSDRAVIGNLRHLDHVNDAVSERVALQKSRQCPACWALNGWSLR